MTETERDHAEAREPEPSSAAAANAAPVEPWVRRLVVVATVTSVVAALGGALLEVIYSAFSW